MSGRTPTHKVLIYVSGQKTQKVHMLSASSSTALIPPSRRGISSADIRVSESSFAEAQFARCAAWSSTYNMSSAMFCRATRTSRFATANMACRSAAGHNEISSTVWRDILSSGRVAGFNRVIGGYICGWGRPSNLVLIVYGSSFTSNLFSHRKICNHVWWII